MHIFPSSVRAAFLTLPVSFCQVLSGVQSAILYRRLTKIHLLKCKKRIGRIDRILPQAILKVKTGH